MTAPSPEQVAATATDEADDVVVAPPTVTDEAAALLALHCTVVQGGVSTPDEERRRILADAARQDDPQAFIDATVEKFAAEVAAAAPAPAPDPTLPIAKFRRYKELRGLQQAGEAEAKAVKEEADKLEAELIEAFSEAGVQNLNLDGKTIYLHRSVYARRCEGVTADDVKAALRAAGAESLVTETVNANTLSAYVREFTEDDDAPGLPEPLVGVLEPGERFGVRIIAGGTKAKSKTHSK